MKATYTSVWDDGYEITTACDYNPKNQTVSDISDSDEEIDGLLTDEYVTVLINGEEQELREEDGVTFDY